MGKYDNAHLAWVNVSPRIDVKYGFRTTIDEDIGEILGHTLVTGQFPERLVIGANSPKPARASRRRAAGYQSSWCSSSAITAARAAGFSVRPGKGRRARSSRLSRTVFVQADGVRMAWNMPASTANNISPDDFTALGIFSALATHDDLVFGASYPALPRVNFVTTTGAGDTNTISTFCDPDRLDSLPSGWGTADTSFSF